MFDEIQIPKSQIPESLTNFLPQNINNFKDLENFKNENLEELSQSFSLALKSKKVLLHVDFRLEAVCCAVLVYNVLRSLEINVQLSFATRETEGYGNSFKTLTKNSKLKQSDFVVVCGFSSEPKPEQKFCHFSQFEEVFSTSCVAKFWQVAKEQNLKIKNDFLLLLGLENGFSALVGLNLKAFKEANDFSLELERNFELIKNAFSEFDLSFEEKFATEKLRLITSVLNSALKFGDSSTVFNFLKSSTKNLAKLLLKRFVERKKLLETFGKELRNETIKCYTSKAYGFCLAEGNFRVGFLKDFAKETGKIKSQNVLIVSEKIGSVEGLQSFRCIFFEAFRPYLEDFRNSRLKSWFKLSNKIDCKSIFTILENILCEEIKLELQQNVILWEEVNLDKPFREWLDFLGLIKIEPVFCIAVKSEKIAFHYSKNGNLLIKINSNKRSLILFTRQKQTLENYKDKTGKVFVVTFILNLELTKKNQFWYGKILDFEEKNNL
ncbi:hypothetical protein IT568_10665 [bacterium]|nr:hypothetical protein [bacterium]